MGIQETNNTIDIQNYAIKLGVNLWRNNRGFFSTTDGKRKYRAGLSADGASDLIGIMPDGKFIAFEVKLGSKKPSKSQKEFGNLILANNGIFGYGSTVEDFMNTLCVFYNKPEQEIREFLLNI